MNNYEFQVCFDIKCLIILINYNKLKKCLLKTKIFKFSLLILVRKVGKTIY